MNYLPPETQVELRRQKITEELASIRLEGEATKGKNFSAKLLTALGGWMVAHGERLREQHSRKYVNYSELTKKAV